MMAARRLYVWACLTLVLAVAACSASDDGASGPFVDDDPQTGADAGSMGSDASTRPDAASAVDTEGGGGVAGECDPVAQDCTSDTSKCVLSLGVPVCIPTDPSDLDRQRPCEVGECATGLACVRATATATAARCQKMCEWADGAGCVVLGPEFECRSQISMTAWGVCVELEPICDPLAPDACSYDQSCQPFLRRTGAWEFRCRALGPSAEGQQCLGSCLPGFVCVSESQGIATCKRPCASNADCPPPSACAGQLDEPPLTFCTE